MSAATDWTSYLTEGAVCSTRRKNGLVLRQRRAIAQLNELALLLTQGKRLLPTLVLRRRRSLMRRKSLLQTELTGAAADQRRLLQKNGLVLR